jgi:hypothetical protein
MKYIFFYTLINLLVIATSNSLIAQEKSILSPEEKAYLFHIVRKSPILEKNIGRYFEYYGPKITFASGEENYDSIEGIIINNPSFLYIRSSEISKSPKGLIAEASNKMALWELNKVLLAKRMEEENPFEMLYYESKLNDFESILIKLLPPHALKKESDDLYIPHKKIYLLLDPSISFNDKKSILESFTFLDKNDRILTMSAINEAINSYISKRTYIFYKELGGEAEVFRNILIAAGDGSKTEGLLEEREKDEQGRWNQGLPKAIGLFPYQFEYTSRDRRNTDFKPVLFSELNFETVGENKKTNLHFDVWGYNSKKQTTVVIEKAGKSYHLFGSGKTRFLSPDSIFGKGATFQTIINDLVNVKIKKLNDMIHGKKGFNFWINHYEKKLRETKDNITSCEMDYTELQTTPISTSVKATKSQRKAAKKGVKLRPTSNVNRKERDKIQNRLISENAFYKEYLKNLTELKFQKENALKLQAEFELRLQYYRYLIGTDWASYTVKDGFYEFEDSTTFDMMTQEFQFKEKEKKEAFTVRLLAIPVDCLSDLGDEVMLHIHLADAEPAYDARLQIHLEDAFESDKYTIDRKLIDRKDSVAVKQLFESILNTKLPLIIKANGNGIGVWNGYKTIKNKQGEETGSYPGITPEERLASRMDSSYARLRKTELIIKTKQYISFEVNSYTDPVASNLAISSQYIYQIMTKNKLSKNQVLSAYRSAFILKKIKHELSILAGEYLDRSAATAVVNRLNNEIDKTKIMIDGIPIKIGILVP